MGGGGGGGGRTQALVSLASHVQRAAGVQRAGQERRRPLRQQAAAALLLQRAEPPPPPQLQHRVRRLLKLPLVAPRALHAQRAFFFALGAGGGLLDGQAPAARGRPALLPTAATLLRWTGRSNTTLRRVWGHTAHWSTASQLYKEATSAAGEGMTSSLEGLPAMGNARQPQRKRPPALEGPAQKERTCAAARCNGAAAAAAAPASASALAGGSCQPGHCDRTMQFSGQLCVKGGGLLAPRGRRGRSTCVPLEVACGQSHPMRARKEGWLIPSILPEPEPVSRPRASGIADGTHGR